MWQMPCPTQEQSVLGGFAPCSGVVLYPRRGTTGSSSPNIPSQKDTLGDTDFVVGPKGSTRMSESALHTPVDDPCYCLHHVESRAAHFISSKLTQ